MSCLKMNPADVMAKMQASLANNDWCKTRSILMPPKKPNPKVEDFRPISVTNVSYRIFMKIMKNRMEAHLKANNLTTENQQAKSTLIKENQSGGIIEDNLFILQHLVETAHTLEKTLIVITLHYTRDSEYRINRNQVLQALQSCAIHPQVIAQFAKTYEDDWTQLAVGKGEETKVKVNYGIKNGCPAAPTMFKIVKIWIIKQLEKEGRGYNIGSNITLHSLCFSDSTLILADSLKSAKHNLKIFTEASKRFRLDIDKGKSSVMVINDKEGIREINNIKVVKANAMTTDFLQWSALQQ